MKHLRFSHEDAAHLITSSQFVVLEESQTIAQVKWRIGVLFKGRFVRKNSFPLSGKGGGRVNEG